jgi:hypothetical protein
MGMGVIPASGKKIMWPQMSVSYLVEGDKIVKEIPYGDVSGFEDFLLVYPYSFKDKSQR